MVNPHKGGCATYTSRCDIRATTRIPYLRKNNAVFLDKILRLRLFRTFLTKHICHIFKEQGTRLAGARWVFWQGASRALHKPVLGLPFFGLRALTGVIVWGRPFVLFKNTI